MCRKKGMKKWIAVLMTGLMMISLCACKETVDSVKESVSVSEISKVEPVVENESKPTTEPEKEVTEEKGVPGVEEIYSQVLDAYYADIVSEFQIDNYIPMTLGTYEAAIECMGENKLGDIGYAVKDINEDGTKELLIMVVSKQGETSCHGERITALYTTVNGEARFLAGGWARNRYYLLTDNRIYNEGSSGVDDASFETFMLIENGGELEQIDAGTLESDDFEQKTAELEKLIETVEIKTFAEYETSKDYPESAKKFWSAYDAVIADDMNTDDTESVNSISRAYAEYIDDVAKDCYTLDELAFATVDVNNDGTRELLYAESSVNAAGVYVCFYDNGKVVPVGPFGCYGGIKYVPAEGKIISVMDNMDYMNYELVAIGNDYSTNVERKFAIEPDSDGSYLFFLDENEVTKKEYSDAFAELQSMAVKRLDYSDMFMYEWTTSDTDIIEQHFEELLAKDEPSRECNMIIPMVEKAKLIGTWDMYSSEFEGQIYYAKAGDVSGKITVHEDYTVDLEFGRHKMKGMQMDFYHGSFNDYAENTDWYVVIDALEEDGTTIYMNVSDKNQLTVNTISEGEILVSLWDIYDNAE